MNAEEWDKLSDGDLIRHRHNHESFTVGGNYGLSGVVASRVVLLHNPEEWNLVAEARYRVIPYDGSDGLPTFKRFMDREQGPEGRLLTQALAMLTTTEEFRDKTPEEVYELLKHQATEVKKQTSDY